MHKRQRGFTLIEIMVVVVILAVLGALVVPKILENVDKARVTRAQSDIRAIQTALDLYRLDNFKYPTTEQGLQALVTQPNDPTHHQLSLRRIFAVVAEGSLEQPLSVRQSGRQRARLRHHQLRTRRQTRRRRLRRGHQHLDARTAVGRLACGCRAMRSKGFTLVEILVVVVIMAVVISLAVLSIGVTGRDSQLDEESRRIEGLGRPAARACAARGPRFRAAHRAGGLRVRGLRPGPRPLADDQRGARVSPPRPAQGRDLSTGTRLDRPSCSSPSSANLDER